MESWKIPHQRVKMLKEINEKSFGHSCPEITLIDIASEFGSILIFLEVYYPEAYEKISKKLIGKVLGESYESRIKN